MASSPMMSSVTGIFKEYLMMDGDVARESSGNDDFEIIGGDSPACSKSDGDGVVVSVEVDLVATGDELSPSKQLDDEESPGVNGMNGEDSEQQGEEEPEIVNGRLEQEGDVEDKPKQSAEDLMDEFGISLDSGVQEEEESKAGPGEGEMVEEDQVSATNIKTEEASITLDTLAKEEEAEPAPQADEGVQEGDVSIEVNLVGKVDDDTPETQDSTQETPETQEMPTDSPADAEDVVEPVHESALEDAPKDITEDSTNDLIEDTPKDLPEDTPEDLPEETPKDLLEDTPEDLPEETPKDLPEDTPKDIPETAEDPNQDSAVDVNLDTSQDTSHDISQEISLDVSLDKPQESVEDEKDSTPEVPPSQDDDQTPTERSLDASLNSEEVPEITSPTSPKPILQRLLSWEKMAKENERYHPGLTRSKSNRLDSSKFSKFETSSSHSSDSESSSGSKRHTITGTGRLNMARFSQFEQGSDSSDGGSRPIKRNTGTRSKSLKFGSATVTSELCHVCQKRVYPMEKITADNIIYHKTCFRCAECKKCLSLGKYAACKGNVFCLPHFKQNFKLKGNYDFTNQPASPRQANGVTDFGDNTDSINIDRSMEGSTLESPRLVEAPISASLNQSEESAPPSIVRSSDRPEESMQVEGGTGSVKSRFERGDFQNPTADTSNKSINIYDAPQEKGVSESTPVRREDIFHANEAQEEVKVTSGGIGKFKNMFEVGGVTNIEVKTSRDPVNVRSLSEYENTNQGHVAESTPVIRDDVIRSSDTSADPGIKRGLSKSLKNRFETEKISNIEEKPREKIEISSPEERRVYQPPEKPRREDVVNSETYSEDPGIKSGQARSLRSLFEKGNVSNVEEKPRAALERNPRSLEDYSTQNQVSESTPIRKEDVVSSSTTVDEPMRSAESTRSLKQRWESGQVERVPEKPKPSLERTPQSLDNYSMTMVVSENTPEERSDIVKSSASSDDYLTSKGGQASSLKAKWESGEVHNADVKTDKTENKPKRFSAYYEGDEQTNGVVEHENGIAEEREEEEEEEDSSADASWEIKAARAAAMAELEDE